MPTPKRLLALGLADAFLAGPPGTAALRERGARVIGTSRRWLDRLAGRVSDRYGASLVNAPRAELAAFIHDSAEYQGAWRPGRRPPRQVAWATEPPRMGPRPAALARARLPDIPTPGDLARWLAMTPAELDWFCDARGQQARVAPGPLRHYTTRWIAKRHGFPRLLEVPKSRLREAQRRILRAILDRVPPHEAVHGFRRGRSVLTFAAPHVAQSVVIRFDLKGFFPGIPASRVHALFRTLGYPEAVARALCGLTTSRVAPDVFEAAAREFPGMRLPWAERRQLRSPHLPQGAPTSPALANLCAHRLDVRLAGLAASVGARYGRYADDLAFSGGETLARGSARFQLQVCRIALEEGFEVNTRKMRVMRAGARQQLTGVVVNRRPNVPREDYDRLKATLHNCATRGPAGEDRAGVADFRAHLAGRVAWVEAVHPARGGRLRQLFERIDWSRGGAGDAGVRRAE